VARSRAIRERRTRTIAYYLCEPRFVHRRWNSRITWPPFAPMCHYVVPRVCCRHPLLTQSGGDSASLPLPPGWHLLRLRGLIEVLEHDLSVELRQKTSIVLFQVDW